ncbi:MAG: HlyD family efflux transporter periplasmic adaptor subunit [Muribaculaceae bacterium]|nr:HlyD family efflux transporter periplasmic adaptor subunit [Muribaculaceae bacterium]
MDIQLKKKPWYIRHVSYIIVGIVFLALTVYVCILAFGPRKLKIDSEEYKIAEAVETPFLEYLDVEGIVHPIQTIQVNALESGFVERIVAEEGSMLEAGDTILVLTNIDLLRAIEDEQSEWENQQRNYQEQEIEMEQRSITLRQQALDAQHQISSLEKSMQQSREEFRMGIKSKAELEVAEEDYEYQHKRAQLQMQSLKHDSVATHLKREMVRANREASTRKLTRTADRTGNLIVRAPVAGQLSFLNVALGQQVGAGSGIGEIKVMSEYKMHVSLPEYYIDRIVSGLPANIQYQDNKYPLRISKVVPEVKDRNFTCDLLFTSDKPSNIRLGKSYRVQIELASPETALVIPRGDFYQATSGHWIYRLSPDGKRARKTEIEIGRQNPQQYEIISGLQPGEKVLLSGYDKFGDIEELVIK